MRFPGVRQDLPFFDEKPAATGSAEIDERRMHGFVALEFSEPVFIFARQFAARIRPETARILVPMPPETVLCFGQRPFVIPNHPGTPVLRHRLERIGQQVKAKAERRIQTGLFRYDIQADVSFIALGNDLHVRNAFAVMHPATVVIGEP